MTSLSDLTKFFARKTRVKRWPTGSAFLKTWMPITRQLRPTNSALQIMESVSQPFVNEGLDATIKLKRSVNSDNAQRKVDGRVEAKLLEVACGPVPKGHSRWTLRILEAQMKIILDEPISREAIRRTLKKNNFDLTAATTGASQRKKTQNS